MKKTYFKKLAVLVFLLIGAVFLNAQNTQPKLFQLEWGVTIGQLESQLNLKKLPVKNLKHYQGITRKDEVSDLKTSSSVSYSATGTPFFDIPSDIIFTFYNSNNGKSGLKLARIEVYLKKKYIDKSWVNIRSTYQTLISYFAENYGITLKRKEEELIFRRLDYEVVVNGVYVNFIADIGSNRLSDEDGIYFVYENNKLKNKILEKEILLEQEKSELYEYEKEEGADVKSRL